MESPNNINKLADQLDKLADQVTEVRITQAQHTILHSKNTLDLAEHMLRTQQNEALLEVHQAELVAIKTSTITKKDLWVIFTTVCGGLITLTTFVLTVLAHFDLL